MYLNIERQRVRQATTHLIANCISRGGDLPESIFMELCDTPKDGSDSYARYKMAMESMKLQRGNSMNDKQLGGMSPFSQVMGM